MELISKKEIVQIFSHYGKNLSPEISKIISYSLKDGIACYLLTKKECKEKIKEYSERIEYLEKFLSSLEFSEDDIKTINRDIYKVLNGKTPSYFSLPVFVPGKPKKEKISGYIYFALDDSGRVKIGKTKKTPNERILNIGINFPAPLSLYHYFKTNDITQEEKSLHRKFSEYRLNGEWFNLSRQQLLKIKKDYR